jgi:hypothetical protein
VKYMNKILMPVIVTAIIFGAGGFFGGMKYQLTKQPFFGQFGGANSVQGRNGTGQNRTGGVRGGGGNFRPINGDIGSFDGSSMTVKMADGSSKVVIVSDTTQINRAANATKDEIKAGEKVMVIGNTNADGSVTADSIQLNPIFQGLRDGTPSPIPAQ